jgi:hypothetical protein
MPPTMGLSEGAHAAMIPIFTWRKPQNWMSFVLPHMLADVCTDIGIEMHNDWSGSPLFVFWTTALTMPITTALNCCQLLYLLIETCGSRIVMAYT